MTNQNLSRVLGPQYEIVPFGIEVGTGPSGDVSNTLDVTITAQEPLEVFRAVGYNGMYTQPVADSLIIYAGITRIAATINDPINVVRSGLMTENSWTWTPNAPIFIEIDGTLTQTQPLAGNPIRRIGWAISLTEVVLDPYPIIGV